MEKRKQKTGALLRCDTDKSNGIHAPLINVHFYTLTLLLLSFTYRSSVC